MEKKMYIKSAMLPVTMLSLALGLRQLSMTIVMPFISTYCRTLAGYTPLLAGLALGIFGLAQAVLQIPFGILSDRYGNKKMLLIGLSMVVVGLVIAYSADNIGLLIFARALQGSGAVIGVAYSWVVSMAGNSERIHALSILGAFISVAAALAFALGPIVHGILPVDHMFLACAVLLFCNVLYILFFIKDSGNKNQTEAPKAGQIWALLKDKTFVSMNLAAFINNFMMVSVFFGVPVYLDKVTGVNGMWKVFVPAIVIAVLFMKGMVKIAAQGYHNQILTAAFLLSSLSLLLYFKENSYLYLLLGTALFLSGYVTLATLIANNINITADSSYRGKVNGIFNSFQYIGNFIGSVVTAAIWTKSDKLAWIVVICVGIAGTLLVTLRRPSCSRIQETKVKK
jgi:MFS family permease